jgi:hypothetical protein
MGGSGGGGEKKVENVLLLVSCVSDLVLIWKLSEKPLVGR